MPTYSGPITITTGGTYSGAWETNDGSPAIIINTTQPVTITNSYARSSGRIFHVVGHADLTVTYSHFYGLNPGGTGQWTDWLLWMDDFKQLTFENNYIESKGGIFLNHWDGTNSAHPVRIRFNKVLNLDGRTTDGAGGYSGSVKTHFVSMSVTDCAGCEIAWNEIHNDPGVSAVEDNISIWSASGTADSPIWVHDNFVYGGWPYPLNVTNYSGGGIMLGDGGGNYQLAENNIVVGTTNYGMAISGGQNMTIRNNRIIGAGTTHDGTPIVIGGNGLYIWNQAPTKPFGNADAHDNVVGWWDAVANARIDMWLPDDTGTHLNNTSPHGGQITVADEDAEYARWQAKVANSLYVIGPDGVAPPDPPPVVPQDITFTPPTVEEGPAGFGPLFDRYRLSRGISVLKEGTSYRQVRTPTQDECEAATVVYLGGHVYPISEDEATALVAAGYGAFVSFVGVHSNEYDTAVYNYDFYG